MTRREFQGLLRADPEAACRLVADAWVDEWMNDGVEEVKRAWGNYLIGGFAGRGMPRLDLGPDPAGMLLELAEVRQVIDDDDDDKPVPGPPPTDAQVAAYLASGGVGCLFCKSEDVAGDGWDIGDDGRTRMHYRCDDCGRHWSDVHGLVGVEVNDEDNPGDAQ